jgi:hypothetical protein
MVRREGFLTSRNFSGLLAAAVLLASPPGISIAASDQTPRDAREHAPAALIGVWKADLSASKFNGQPPRHYLRSFEYTRDGMIQVSFLIQGANGADIAGHWAVRLDGTPGPEYRREYGSIPYMEVSLKMIDANTFALAAGRHGDMYYTGSYKLSPDGNTLTYSYRSGANSPEDVVVLRRWIDRE